MMKGKKVKVTEIMLAIIKTMPVIMMQNGKALTLEIDMMVLKDRLAYVLISTVLMITKTEINTPKNVH